MNLKAKQQHVNEKQSKVSKKYFLFCVLLLRIFFVSLFRNFSLLNCQNRTNHTHGSLLIIKKNPNMIWNVSRNITRSQFHSLFIMMKIDDSTYHVNRAVDNAANFRHKSKSALRCQLSALRINRLFDTR